MSAYAVFNIQVLRSRLPIYFKATVNASTPTSTVKTAPKKRRGTMPSSSLVVDFSGNRSLTLLVILRRRWTLDHHLSA